MEQALITGAAALIGAAIGVFGGILADRARWQRERAVRWEDQQRAAYMKLVDGAHRLMYLVGVAAMHPKPDMPRIWRLAFSNTLELLVALSEVKLIAPARVREKAEALDDRLGKLVQLIEERDLEAVMGEFRSIGSDVDAFVEVARAQLEAF